MSKFFKFEISRRKVTDLYLIVPDGFKPSFTKIHPAILEKAVRDTISDGEWMDEDDVLIEGWKEVTEKEASEYLMYDVTKEEPAGKYWREK